MGCSGQARLSWGGPEPEVEPFGLDLHAPPYFPMSAIKEVSNEARLEGLRSFFCELCQHITERKIKKTVVEYGQGWLYSEEKLTQGSCIYRLYQCGVKVR